MLEYHLVDVFTDRQFGGNQLAVFPNPGKLSTEFMQTIARELNLSETVFVFPPDDPANHYRLRIFTPHMELPLAGHPTVGTGFVLANLGMIPKTGITRLEEGVGPIPITLTETESGVLVEMAQPQPQFGDVKADRAQIAALLSLNEDDLMPDLPVQTVSSGVPFIFVPLKSLDAANRIKLRLDIWDQAFKGEHIYTFTMQTQNPQAQVHSRMFAPAMGIPEDPATGAACGPLGAYLVQHGLAPSEIINEQGVEMGRPSLIHIRVMESSVYVGGYSQPIGGGYLTIQE